MLALVVGRDRAVGAGKLAAEGHDERSNRAQAAHVVRLNRARGQIRSVARAFQKPVAEDGVGKLVEVAEQALDSGVHKLFGSAGAVRSGIHQARDVIEHAGVAGAQERRSQGFVGAAG